MSVNMLSLTNCDKAFSFIEEAISEGWMEPATLPIVSPLTGSEEEKGKKVKLKIPQPELRHNQLHNSPHLNLYLNYPFLFMIFTRKKKN